MGEIADFVRRREYEIDKLQVLPMGWQHKKMGICLWQMPIGFYSFTDR